MRTIVITGASSGIGAAAAHALARHGAQVLLVARREEALNRLVADIKGEGGRAAAFVADLAETSQVEDLADRLLAAHPHIDVLINNAGRSIRRGIIDSLDRPHDFERTMALNYHAAVRLTLRLLPGMLARDDGHIINVSSQSTQMPMPRFSAYIASKSALEGFSRSIAAELAGSGIAVSIVNYPLVRTDMSAATKMYSRLPMMSAEAAADWLVQAVEKRPARVATRLGRAWHLSTVTAPGVTTELTGRFMNYMAKRLAR
mgnify:CR=1 FL=1